VIGGEWWPKIVGEAHELSFLGETVGKSGGEVLEGDAAVEARVGDKGIETSVGESVVARENPKAPPGGPFRFAA
jgi:hypothetical protein